MIDYPSAAETRWFAGLKRHLRAMPASVEVTVHVSGVVEMHRRGETMREFEREGHTDNVPDLGSFTARNLRGQESSV